jgi:hypothetical protein
VVCSNRATPPGVTPGASSQLEDILESRTSRLTLVYNGTRLSSMRPNRLTGATGLFSAHQLLARLFGAAASIRFGVSTAAGFLLEGPLPGNTTRSRRS